MADYSGNRSEPSAKVPVSRPQTSSSQHQAAWPAQLRIRKADEPSPAPNASSPHTSLVLAVVFLNLARSPCSP